MTEPHDWVGLKALSGERRGFVDLAAVCRTPRLPIDGTTERLLRDHMKAANRRLVRLDPSLQTPKDS